MKEKLFIIFASFASTVLLTAVLPVSGDNLVGGVISKDTRWTADEGPYVVTQDILVTKRGHLTIGPGTTVFVGKAVYKEKTIPQIDALDSVTIAITIEGGLDCVGRPDKRISFVPQAQDRKGPQWYGIVLRKIPENYAELAYTDISGAYNAVSVYDCSPSVHHCRIDFNNAGIVCGGRGDVRVFNCVIVNNFTAGVKVSSANPVFRNNIVAFNRNNGVWCDGSSKITFEYNCVFGNPDGNLLDCDPMLGVLKKKNERKDSVDYRDNIFKNPVFAGSESDSVAVERDFSLPTDKSRIKDTSLAKVLEPALQDSTAAKKRGTRYMIYSLSKYSPCIRAGSPSQEFKNSDGSRADMGMYGSSRYAPKRK
jgi:parallel beta-helix repeat protein